MEIEMRDDLMQTANKSQRFANNGGVPNSQFSVQPRCSCRPKKHLYVFIAGPLVIRLCRPM